LSNIQGKNDQPPVDTDQSAFICIHLRLINYYAGYDAGSGGGILTRLAAILPVRSIPNS
jgi:hypothetical protein